MKKVLIAGAGIAGLSAGIYARRSGFDVTVYESGRNPGGASTSWRRKGYLFEGGLHWLTGSSPKVPLNRLWLEVGALSDRVPVSYRDPFLVFDGSDGQKAYLYRDLKKLRAHFLALSPEDAPEINRFCRDVRRFTKFNMPIVDVKGVQTKKKSSVSLPELARMLPAFPRLTFYAKQTVREYAARFKSPLIQNLLESLVGSDLSATGLAFTLATLAAGDGGYPHGGSLAMAGRMADQLEALGGTIRYGETVSGVSVENGSAKGVLVNGAFVAADAVILTQDTRTAIDTMFESPLEEPWAKRMRENTRPMLDTFIGLGIEADLSDIPERVNFVPDEPFLCGGEQMKTIGICNYAGYAGYAPDGCTALTTILMGDSYDFWKACRESGTYQAEKEKLARSFIRILEKKYPRVAGKVAVFDVATPLTYARYLRSYKGSWMSFVEKGQNPETFPSKPEAIGQVYFAGQRLRAPGGTPVAVDSGRRAVQYLCKDTGTVFEGCC